MPLTLDDVSWPLTTGRLLLRRASADDAAAVFRYRSLPGMGEWMYRLDVDPAAFATRFAEPDHLGPTLVVELDGVVVGDLIVRVHDAWAQDEIAPEGRGTQAEIGWSFDPAVQGQGLATEAASALLDLCFDTLGLHRVTAICFSDNEPSWRIMERLGMRRETHALEESLHRSGRWLDSFTYAMLRREWLVRRPG